MEAAATVESYIAAQNAGDIAGCVAVIADDAVFDVGRGRYAGKDQVTSFVKMLIGRQSRTEILESRAEGDSVHGLWRQSDDDGRGLGVEWVQLEAHVTVRDGKINSLHARPTPESLAALRAAAESRQGLTPEARRALDEPG
jgi:SnoaL-like domain